MKKLVHFKTSKISLKRVPTLLIVYTKKKCHTFF